MFFIRVDGSRVRTLSRSLSVTHLYSSCAMTKAAMATVVDVVGPARKTSASRPRPSVRRRGESPWFLYGKRPRRLTPSPPLSHKRAAAPTLAVTVDITAFHSASESSPPTPSVDGTRMVGTDGVSCADDDGHVAVKQSKQTNEANKQTNKQTNNKTTHGPSLLPPLPPHTTLPQSILYPSLLSPSLTFIVIAVVIVVVGVVAAAAAV